MSTVFIRDFFKSRMEVTEYWIDDFSEENLDRILKTKFDLYVVFQYDFLSIFLRAHGRRVVSVPMYDGSGEAHPAHWLLQKGALMLNFSEALHQTHENLSLDSIQRQYFPKPSSELTQSYDSKRVFFWERTPSSGLSATWMAEQLKNWVTPPSHVHLHLSADPCEYSSIHPDNVAELFPQSIVTTSTWFAKKSEFLDVFGKFNIFIASRPNEGIGFSFLEAMSHGMVIYGLDRPTLNEYIENGRTGYLLGHLHAGIHEPSAEEMHRVGSAARRKSELGRGAWESGLDDLHERVERYVSTAPPAALHNLSPRQAARIAYYFFNDTAAYNVACVQIARENRLETNDKQLQTTRLARISEKLTDRPVMRSVVRATYPMMRRILVRR
ncbi:hypothetical protein QTH87_01435 [Variovorax sp. J22P168]|uniref:glycosyltransferase n=1 Tax=Variovorax jilinensis TaxID=3053513 RepID=UPI002577F1BD|nr:hypothetical protein [Variovorax sp. J22P168]MDM0011088.1 hypothetical protein [Variovorax sp. J22P168]